MQAQKGLAGKAGSRLSSDGMALLWLLVRGGPHNKQVISVQKVSLRGISFFLNVMTAMLAVLR